MMIENELFVIQTICILAILFNIRNSMSLLVKGKRNILTYSYFTIVAGFSLWVVVVFVKTLSYNADVYYLALLLQFCIAIPLLSPSFFIFGYVLYFEKNPSKKIWIYVIVSTIIMILTLATDNITHLFITNGYGFFDEDFGPAYIVFCIMGYAMLLGGAFFVALKAKKLKNNTSKAQNLLINSCVALSMMCNIANATEIQQYLWDILGLNILIDPTSIMFSITNYFWYIAIFKYSLIDVMPVLERNTIDYVDTGIFIDNNSELVCNKSASDFPSECKDVIRDDFTNGETVKAGKNFYEVSKYYIDSESVVTMLDITRYVKMENQFTNQYDEFNKIKLDLDEKLKLAENMSKEDTKFFIAREIHDVLGHSMTLSVKLTELASSLYKDGRKSESKEKILLSRNTIIDGYKQFLETIKGTKSKQYSVIILREKIKDIIDKIKIIDIDIILNFESKLTVVEAAKYKVILRLIQEGITNSVKHGNPKKIIVSIKIREEQDIEIYVVDNGKGCKEIKEGNGLMGIKERVKKLNGEFSYSFNNGTGFKLFVKI